MKPPKVGRGMTHTTKGSSVSLAPAVALIVAAFAVGPASTVHAQSTPPTATECGNLIRRAQDDAQRRKMTMEELGRTNLCLSLMKKSQPPSATIRIFRN